MSAVSAGFAVSLLVATLVVAVARPRGLPEAAGAVPAAVLVVATGLVPAGEALDEVRQLAPTAVLSLDATVVLLTPVVLGAAARSRLRPEPHVYACGHLANSASLLLPVSNLTNLLAFAAADVSFTRFAALIAAPWLVAILVEYAVLRRWFAGDLALATPAAGEVRRDRPALPRLPLAVLALTLAGFALAPLAGVDPALVATAAVALAVHALRARSATPASLLRAASPPFLAFVLGLGIVVRGVQDTGLGRLVAHLVPTGSSLLALLGIALLAALLANLVNNVPAVLVLLPALSAAGTPAVLAGLLGVNLGPNLTHAGSLATLLWRRLLHERDVATTRTEFLRLGLRSVPLTRVVEAGSGAVGGFLGRRPDPERVQRLEAELRVEAERLLGDAARRLGRPVRAEARSGHPERLVVAAAEGADLLVLARDGDRSRLGPRSLGPHTRFVVDHAPCPVLLVWPDATPGLGSIPPPPGGR